MRTARFVSTARGSSGRENSATGWPSRRKKQVFLESDPKAEDMDQDLRERWLRETREDIERTRKLLEEFTLDDGEPSVARGGV